MSQVTAVLDLLTRTNQDFDHTQHRSRRARRTLYVILGPLYTAAIAGAVFLLLRLIQGEESLTIWVGLMPLISFSIHLAQLFISFNSDSRAPFFTPVATLRDAIRTGDATLAPTVTESAAPALTPSASSPTRIGPLPRPIKWSSLLIVLAIGAPVILTIAVPLLFAYVSIQAGAITGVTLLLIATVSGLLAYRKYSPVYVRVDSQGLRWRRLFGGHHHLTWQSAQALVQIANFSSYFGESKTAFILYGADRIFTWNVTGPAWHERAATLSLIHTITQHTSLPLRDISTEVKRITFGAKSPVPTNKATPQERKYRFRVLGIVVTPFIIIALVAGAIQIAEPFYFEHVYTQSHASAPLYADPLTHKDSDWPETAEARFTSASYTVTHDLELFGFHSSLILPPHRYNNALYVVTARSYGDTEAGLAIRGARSSQPILAFYVDPKGGWWLEQDILDGKFHDHLFWRLGDSSAIHPGLGAPNRIAILVQGSDFTFYVNGHYITRYHDDHLAGGNVGLYLDPEDGQGSFSDFAVYPA